MSTKIIAKHLQNRDALKIEKVDSICAFTGGTITEGVALKNTISSNFTDNVYIRYDSKYCAVDIAQCMQPISKDNRASLRNYSFLATETELKLLNRDNLFDTVINDKSIPFVLCVTFNAKKHISYKTRIQYSNNDYIVFTDAGEVRINKSDLSIILPIIKSWYTVIDGKENTSTQPTYFTKDEILTGEVMQNKILQYGYDRYFNETQILEAYRNSLFLKLLVFILKKTKHQ